jgi:hypothetical protein
MRLTKNENCVLHPMTRAPSTWMCAVIAIAIIGAAVGAANSASLIGAHARISLPDKALFIGLLAALWLIVLATAFVLLKAKAMWLLLSIPLVMLGPLELLSVSAACTISVRSCAQAVQANPGL